MNRAVMIWLCGVLAAASAFSRAQASALDAAPEPTTLVLASQSDLVQDSAANETTLQVPGAGELYVTLTDLQFPTSFASLQFALTDATSTLVGLHGASTMSLNLTGPTSVYADVFATTQGGYGLYNLSATFDAGSPVPLPGSAVCLATGCLLLLWLRATTLVPLAGERSMRATVIASMV